MKIYKTHQRMQPQNDTPTSDHRVTSVISPSTPSYKILSRIPSCPQPQYLQCPQPQLEDNQQSFDIPDRYVEQIRLRGEWEEKIERLNEKYNIDCFSSSELDSETDSDSDYLYMITNMKLLYKNLQLLMQNNIKIIYHK